MKKRPKILTEKIKTSVTKEMKQELAEEAKALNLKVSELFRRKIENKSVYTNLLISILNEFKKQGNNINQIAKHCNETNQINSEVIQELIKIKEMYWKIFEEVKIYDDNKNI